MAKHETTDIRAWVVPFKFLPVGAHFHRVLPFSDTQEWVIASSRVWMKWAAGSAEDLRGRIMNIGPEEPVRQLFV